MAKAFSIASWNVEHFRKPASNASAAKKKAYNERKPRVVQFIKDQQPDVITIYEVEGKEIYNDLASTMTGYSFHITEGAQVQEILVGVKHGIDAFFTQKIAFKSGSSYLRPGALLTVNVDSEVYSLLFLHTKSGADPKGFGLRDDMLQKSVKFRKILNKASTSENGANYIFMGDLNTMGMRYPYKKSIDFSFELKRADNLASRYYKMRRLTKTHAFTYCNGSKSSYPKSDLDHVYASKHLQFKQFSESDVKVTGWVDANDDATMDKWIEEYSDHSLLYMEVQKV